MLEEVRRLVALHREGGDTDLGHLLLALLMLEVWLSTYLPRAVADVAAPVGRAAVAPTSSTSV